MCGISGLVYLDNTSVQKEEIEGLNNLVKHRGPDGSGVYTDGNVGLGHTRLSILDLSSSGHQPMIGGEDYVLVYNGEIYNFIEIREELILKGYKFFSTSDSEVVLKSYMEWGEGCVERFNGMWSLAIYDKKKQLVFCSRDRFGIKPFYYYKDDKKMVFASELKQVISYLPTIKADRKILMDYLVLGLENHNERTFFRDVKNLTPGTNLFINLSNNSIEKRSFYELRSNIQRNVSDKTASLQELFQDSIKLRLRSDVSVGSCLSGGLDSSIISAVASKEYLKVKENKFLSIHAKSSESKSDESSFAKLVSKENFIDLNVIEPTVEDFTDSMDDVVRVQEEPFSGTSVFMQYFVMKKAKELGCKVLLDGQGADEVFLGYDKYNVALIFHYLRRLKLFTLVKELMCQNVRFKNMVLLTLFFGFPFLKKIILLRKASFLSEEYLKDLSIKERNSYENYFDVFNMQVNEIYHPQLPHLLRYEDKNSMNFSVETRLPFLDFRLVEFGVGLPLNKKIFKGWSKYILRKDLGGCLPQSVRWRRDKIGFASPESTWLDKVQLEPYVISSSILKEIIKPGTKLSTIPNKYKWKLINISVWERIFNVKM
ncbi:MAG: asparagine synthase (glutamine-hydrolyzing) [Halobacteriovoraceae bacterium]|nr:asparagine synthase (glutamine-hydrolyzing) [Halobacteriovoraceae bacterium]|tara:strand:+ start:2975 stop:4768 length:1794 start_codon:yes stop_codon:yes gene_type:complete